MRFLYAYILCCIVFGLVVAIYEIRKKTYRGRYIMGSFMFPSVVFGNWMYSIQSDPINEHSENFLRLQWMSRIHALLLLASILLPYEYLGAEIARFAEPGIQTNSHVAAGAEVAVDLAFVAIGGLVSFIEFLVWTVAYMLLVFLLVILPRLVRPKY